MASVPCDVTCAVVSAAGPMPLPKKPRRSGGRAKRRPEASGNPDFDRAVGDAHRIGLDVFRDRRTHAFAGFHFEAAAMQRALDHIAVARRLAAMARKRLIVRTGGYGKSATGRLECEWGLR